MTHLFADGGRIVKSTRTDYSEHLGRENMREIVKGLMKEQHKAMFVALRSGEYDDVIGFDEEAPSTSQGQRSSVTDPSSSAAAEHAEAKPTPSRKKPSLPPEGPKSYAAPRPASIFADEPPRSSLFGENALDEKSLDEAILSYLSEDGESE